MSRPDLQEDVKRHVKIVLADKDADPDGPFVDKEGREYTEEELDDLAAQCLETGTNPFAAGLAQTALEDVLRKHAEIVKIERSIEEVAELFNDLAILVTAQGEVLDNIEDHVRRIGRTLEYLQSPHSVVSCMHLLVHSYGGVLPLPPHDILLWLGR